MARRDDYGPVQLADRLGLPRWQVETAIRLGLIARPDVKDSRWSEVVAADAAARKAEIAAAVQADAEANRAIGAWRAADHLSTRLHLDVDVDDVVQLAEAGVIEVADYYKNNPLYRVRDLDELAADVVEPVVTKRLQWIQSSTTVQDAAARFGWRVAEFTAAARRRGITAGRDERYALVDVDELAADDQAVAEVERARLLGPDQAAERLEIRRTDFDYLRSAGLIEPASSVDSKVGRRWITIPLYRTGDVDDLTAVELDWEAARTVKPGEASPFQAIAPALLNRAAVIRGFAQAATQRHVVSVTARYDGRRDRWRLEVAGTAELVDQLEHDLHADPAAARYTDQIDFTITEETTA